MRIGHDPKCWIILKAIRSIRCVIPSSIRLKIFLICLPTNRDCDTKNVSCAGCQRKIIGIKEIHNLVVHRRRNVTGITAINIRRMANCFCIVKESVLIFSLKRIQPPPHAQVKNGTDFGRDSALRCPDAAARRSYLWIARTCPRFSGRPQGQRRGTGGKVVLRLQNFDAVSQTVIIAVHCQQVIAARDDRGGNRCVVNLHALASAS